MPMPYLHLICIAQKQNKAEFQSKPRLRSFSFLTPYFVSGATFNSLYSTSKDNIQKKRGTDMPLLS